MKNTKEKILHSARILFNKLGYAQVTIRMIALDLGMSSGNLNYHFRKREDILEALYFEMVEAFDHRIQDLENQKITLEHMQIEIQSSMSRMIHYQFFWTDLYNLLNANKKIKAHFHSVRKNRINGYQFVFKSLVSQQILHEGSFPKEHLYLTQRIINYSNTWLYVSSLYEQKETETQLIEHASFHLMSMLYPYLSNEGKSQFKSIHQAFFS